MNCSFDAFVVFTKTFPETISLFYNASQAARKASQEPDWLSSKGKLMHDFACTTADQMYYNRLAERTRFFKATKEGEASMNELLEKYRTEAEGKGIEKGIEQGRDNTLIALVHDGLLSVEIAADRAGVSIDDFKAMMKKVYN